MNTITTLQEYKDFFQDIKERIQQAQIKAMLSVNKELLLLYWKIGKRIIEIQEQAKW